MLCSRRLLPIVAVFVLLEEISAVALRKTFRNKRVAFHSLKNKSHSLTCDCWFQLWFSALRKLVYWIGSSCCVWMIRLTSQWVAQGGQAVKLFNWRPYPCQSTSTSISTSVKPVKRGMESWCHAVWRTFNQCFSTFFKPLYINPMAHHQPKNITV